uniref:Uncharacterized protein n=2 Tax=Helicotheca tamesis TaxID=374047 RepID=A0A7S2MVT6_9STRA
MADGWIVGQIAFIYAFNKVKPAEIVDKLISLIIDIVTPGRGAGESNWWMRGLRSLEQSAERTRRELDIRSDLRQWDEEFPFAHHELIVRYAVGALASTAAIFIYGKARGMIYRKR